MNRTLVIAEWKRAKFSLRAASSCLRDRCYADAVSRAYYAAFHAARAALSNLQGVVLGQSHGNIRQQFGLQLVQTGRVERQWGSEIGHLYGLRMKADYDVVEEFLEAFARAVYQRSARFLERILRLLTATIPSEELT